MRKAFLAFFWFLDDFLHKPDHFDLRTLALLLQYMQYNQSGYPDYTYHKPLSVASILRHFCASTLRRNNMGIKVRKKVKI